MMIETLESRELFSATLLPAVQNTALNFSNTALNFAYQTGGTHTEVTGGTNTEISGVVWSGVYDRAGSVDFGRSFAAGQTSAT